ncbi:DUF5677 domain-containing protein [Nocardia farcinica]|uniref:DUF5677 domain-containing protein n=1 Tax=Nocardia farcinica TaxID=37329 RepID=UPI002458ECFC|nr:DUF5677 domain-containing protein [Nocardia farcinica]
MPKQPNIEQTGPLAGHIKRGKRIFLPPLAATDALHMGDWVRDDVPDLLWPILLLHYGGTEKAKAFAEWQRAVISDAERSVEPRALGEGLDGRLTSLDRLVREYPALVEIVRTHAEALQMLPPAVVDALAPYPETPARWLIGEELKDPTKDSLNLMAAALFDVLRDGHREALVKCISIWSRVQAGTFSAGREIIDLLMTYPNDPRKRGAADSVIRASWGAYNGALLHNTPDRFDEAVKWAKVFWEVNSMTTRCIRRREVEDQKVTKDVQHADPQDNEATTKGAEVQETDDGRRQQIAKDLASSFVEALETAPQRLYDPERQEVISGLIMRAARDVIAVLGAPDLWCFEHGAHVGRCLVEVRIYIEWMARQDASIYREFQDYGAGKAKLYAQIVEELPEAMKTPAVQESIEAFRKLSRNHPDLDTRVVDTRDTFAGKSLRAMAQECGLLDYYRHAYAVASGVSHSEWWSVETHAMERCMNILHRGHLIPSLSLQVGGNEELADSWLGALHALIKLSLEILGTDEDAVQSAFAWLEGEEEPEDSTK